MPFTSSRTWRRLVRKRVRRAFRIGKEDPVSEQERWFRGHLKELSRDECWELLSTRPVGRVGYADPEGPVILPVNFVLEDRDTVLFRTAPHSALAQHLMTSLSAVSFQVDDFDEYTQSGWSVLVRGQASFAEHGDLPVEDDERPNPWVEGTRTLFVRITPHKITGRRLLPA